MDVTVTMMMILMTLVMLVTTTNTSRANIERETLRLRKSRKNKKTRESLLKNKKTKKKDRQNEHCKLYQKEIIGSFSFVIYFEKRIFFLVHSLIMQTKINDRHLAQTVTLCWWH